MSWTGTQPPLDGASAPTRLAVTAPSNRAWIWFMAWIVVGVGYALAFVGALSIGVFVLPIPVVLTVLLARYQPSPRSALGLLCGLGVPPLYVAYLNRSYGGPACATSGTVTLQEPNVVHECIQALDPWPWLAGGALLVAAGCALFISRRRVPPGVPAPNRQAQHGR